MEGLLSFLEHIELDRSLEQGDENATDRVTLITVHNTKGLEFRRVIITGLEQGLFPRSDKTGEDLEEERRLFYVAVTRAMDELYMTSCAQRRIYGHTEFCEPSLFLFEADKSAIKITGELPYGFAAASLSAPSADWQVTEQPRPGARPANPSLLSPDGRWKLGDAVFHDDHGYGEVTGFLPNPEGDDEPVICIRFQSGHETRFLSKSQAANYTKIRF
jgi:DNA helicase-2/ATP-dependent DNA helicase PcrA